MTRTCLPGQLPHLGMQTRRGRAAAWRVTWPTPRKRQRGGMLCGLSVHRHICAPVLTPVWARVPSALFHIKWCSNSQGAVIRKKQIYPASASNVQKHNKFICGRRLSTAHMRHALLAAKQGGGFGGELREFLEQALQALQDLGGAEPLQHTLHATVRGPTAGRGRSRGRGAGRYFGV